VCCARVPAVPGLEDDRDAADEKKKAYQVEFKRYVCTHEYLRDLSLSCDVFRRYLKSFLFARY